MYLHNPSRITNDNQSISAPKTPPTYSSSQRTPPTHRRRRFHHNHQKILHNSHGLISRLHTDHPHKTRRRLRIQDDGPRPDSGRGVIRDTIPRAERAEGGGSVGGGVVERSPEDAPQKLGAAETGYLHHYPGQARRREASTEETLLRIVQHGDQAGLCGQG